MADFKLYGGTEPAITNLGDMTQGIGFPLRPVEGESAVSVQIVRALEANDFTDQIPTALGVAIPVLLGPAQTTPFFDVDASGNVTCLVTATYQIRLKAVVGRRGSAGGVAQLYLRARRNGIQNTPSSQAIIDNPDIEIPIDLEETALITAGDVVVIELIRDTDGVNQGGLYAGIPDVPGWNSSPSARLIIDRIVAVPP